MKHPVGEKPMLSVCIECQVTFNRHLQINTSYKHKMPQYQCIEWIYKRANITCIHTHNMHMRMDTNHIACHTRGYRTLYFRSRIPRNSASKCIIVNMSQIRKKVNANQMNWEATYRRRIVIHSIEGISRLSTQRWEKQVKCVTT